jgi:Na+/melibiose symporter-like transporter
MQNKTMEEDHRHIEFLAINSKEIIEKQVDSYRQQHSYAGTIIGFTVLYIPFFLNSLDGTNQILQLISILPIALFIVSLLLYLSIFRGKPLDQALSVTKYNELLTKSYNEILRYEIEANKVCYLKNNIATLRANRRYMQGIALTTIAIIISIIMILLSTFLAIEKRPTKVQVVEAAVKQPYTTDKDTLPSIFNKNSQ